jgi:hypothetical protein
MRQLTPIISKNDYPFKNTPLQLCFEAEITRISKEREEPMAETVDKLAQLAGVTSRQIYNYKSGKSEITPDLVKTFCFQFGSTALGCAWLTGFGIEQPECDQFDLTLVVSRKTQNVLRLGTQMFEAFEDNKIDGFELNKLHTTAAAIVRDARHLVEYAQSVHQRQRGSRA